MADVKIIVEEKLGGQVSFGGKEIRILKSTYEAVPEDKRSEFDEVLIKAQEVYQNKVAEVKKTGERPQASKLKAEAIAEVVTPFLEANSVSKGTVSRGTGATRVVKPTVGTRESRLKQAESNVDKATLQQELDDFPADMLDDSSEETATPTEPKGDFDDLADELGLDDVFGEGEEEADVFGGQSGEGDPFGSSSEDPFGSSSEDPFDDIDLDV